MVRLQMKVVCAVALRVKVWWERSSGRAEWIPNLSFECRAAMSGFVRSACTRC